MNTATEGETTERVILVDAHDVETGTEEKLQAHRAGVLHRAFSVFVVDGNRRILLQRRAPHKYHSAGLWSNTACGHPRPGEKTLDAAMRRLREEMGFSCPLTEAFDFIYKLPVTTELTEHELDHVFVGRWQGTPTPDRSEVSEWAWRDIATLDAAVRDHPEQFSVWFPVAWPRARDYLAGRGGPQRA